MEASEDDPLIALEKALIQLAGFVRDNRMLILGLARDVAAGDTLVADFARRNLHRHARILFKLVKECQRQGKLRKLPVLNVASIFIGAIGVPNVFVEVMDRVPMLRVMGPALFGSKKEILSDQAVRERVWLAMDCFRVRGDGT
jgi:hypothetical protein